MYATASIQISVIRIFPLSQIKFPNRLISTVDSPPLPGDLRHPEIRPLSHSVRITEVGKLKCANSALYCLHTAAPPPPINEDDEASERDSDVSEGETLSTLKWFGTTVCVCVFDVNTNKYTSRTHWYLMSVAIDSSRMWIKSMLTSLVTFLPQTLFTFQVGFSL